MKKRIISAWMAAALGWSALALCPVTASAAPIDDAYRAYYDFLQDELDSIGLPPTDVPESELLQYTGPVVWVNEEVHFAKLLDFDNNGIPELIYGKSVNVKEGIGGALVDCIYTYANGKMVRLAGDIGVDWDYNGIASGWDYKLPISTGKDGRIYVKHTSSVTLFTDYTFSSLVNGQWKEVQKMGRWFQPDIYISPDVHTSTGEMIYYYDPATRVDHPVPHATWYARLDELQGGGEQTLQLKNSLEPTIAELSKRVDANYISYYRTPSSWAAESVNQGITLGVVPKTFQKKYNNPITRGEFCALATAFYEKVSATSIPGRAQFTDTSDVNIQKMGSLGVIQGVGNGKFAPDQLLTREQAAVILTNLSKALGKELSSATPSFADNSSISSWASAEVGKVQAAGIMAGVENGRFAPQGSYTREQSIATIMRMRSTSVVEPTGLKLTPGEDSIRASKTCSITAKVLPENATNLTIASWKSSDEKVAKVSANGVVTGVSAGTATITATTSNGISGSCTITVRPEFELTIKGERLPATVNCLYLDEGSWSRQDVDYVPKDAKIAGTLKVTDVSPSTRSSSSLLIVTVSGELASLNDGFSISFDPYLKYDVKDENGKVVASGIANIYERLREKGDAFESNIYLNKDDNIDLDKSYTISFRNDSGKTVDDLMDEAPEVALPRLPFTVSDKYGTMTIEDVDIDISYSAKWKEYRASISFSGNAEIANYMGPKFIWELRDSSGAVVAHATDYATSIDVEEDESFVLEPSSQRKNISLESGESYSLTLSENK